MSWFHSIVHKISSVVRHASHYVRHKITHARRIISHKARNTFHRLKSYHIRKKIHTIRKATHYIKKVHHAVSRRPTRANKSRGRNLLHKIKSWYLSQQRLNNNKYGLALSKIKDTTDKAIFNPSSVIGKPDRQLATASKNMGKLTLDLVNDRNTATFDPLASSRNNKFTVTDNKAKLYGQALAQHNPFIPELTPEQKRKQSEAIRSGLLKLKGHVPDKVWNTLKFTGNLLGVDSWYKTMYNKDIYTGEPAKPSPLDIVNVVADIGTIGLASAGKLAGKLGFQVINEGEKVGPDSMKPIFNAMKSTKVTEEATKTIEDAIKAAPKTIDGASSLIKPTFMNLLNNAPSQAGKLGKWFYKVVTDPRVTVPLMGAMLVSQMDVLGWGFHLTPSFIETKMDNLNKNINSNLYKAQQAMKDKNPQLAKDLLEKNRKLIADVRKVTESMPARFWSHFGLNVQDKLDVVDSLEVTNERLIKKIPNLNKTLPTPEEIPDQIVGKVTGVYDGDTFWIDNKYKVRLVGIDAPEEGTDAGLKSRNFLRDMILNKNITCDVDPLNKVGAYGRVLGYCSVDGVNINKEMIKTLNAKPLIEGRNKYVDPDELKKLYQDAKVTTEKVKITSSPSHARIILDGEDTQRYTSETFKLPFGHHVVILRKEGYNDYKETFDLEKGQPVEIYGALSPLETSDMLSKISVGSSPEVNAYIYVDGVYSGHKTPYVVQVIPGKHTIELVKKNYKFRPESVNVEKDSTFTLIVEAHEIKKPEEQPPEEAKKAMLSVLSWPSSAFIMINGIYSGRTPKLLKLDPGDYEITLKKNKYQDSVRHVVIYPDEEISIEVNMEPTPKAPAPAPVPKIKPSVPSVSELLSTIKEFIKSEIQKAIAEIKPAPAPVVPKTKEVTCPVCGYKFSVPIDATYAECPVCLAGFNV